MTIAESPPLDIAIEDLIRDAYGFSELRAQSVLQGGMFARPVLLCTDRGLFLLRIHTFRGTVSAFQFQAEAIESAWRAGVICPRVEPTQNGAWCVPLASSHGIIALHQFVEGRCDDWITWHGRKQSQSGFLHALGRRVAELHNALGAAHPGGESSLDSSLPPIQFSKLHEQFGAWRADMDRLQRETNLECADAREQLLSLGSRIDTHWQRLLAADARHRPGLLPRQVVHGDISPVNMVFDTDDRPAFIDWDCVHCGLRMYDALGDVLNRPPDDCPEWNRFNKENVDEYLDGYAVGLTRPLSELELRLAPTFCLARQLEDLRQRLYGLSTLDASQNTRYARLIAMRVDMMDQLQLY
jgi:Ser/Thr protein kinase RdoA (MazF antagonist)